MVYSLLCSLHAGDLVDNPWVVNQANAKDRRLDYCAAHNELAAAHSVLVVGGGDVAVELAAEIVGKWGTRKLVRLVFTSRVSYSTCILNPCIPENQRSAGDHSNQPRPGAQSHAASCFEACCSLVTTARCETDPGAASEPTASLGV